MRPDQARGISAEFGMVPEPPARTRCLDSRDDRAHAL
jgi:hypothetical protein